MPIHTFSLERVATPLGQMLVLTDSQQRLRAVDWEDYETRMVTLLRRQYGKDAVQVRDAAGPSAARRALEAYFDGDVAAINGLPVALGGTDFQRRVWQALRGIAGGQTNPVGIVIPCHRVIGANASLTGYGGGLHRKRWLLEHEARHSAH